jgi:hypothetical protein
VSAARVQLARPATCAVHPWHAACPVASWWHDIEAVDEAKESSREPLLPDFSEAISEPLSSSSSSIELV